jgi:hypothetical protein
MDKKALASVGILALLAGIGIGYALPTIISASSGVDTLCQGEVRPNSSMYPSHGFIPSQARRVVVCLSNGHTGKAQQSFEVPNADKFISVLNKLEPAKAQVNSAVAVSPAIRVIFEYKFANEELFFTDQAFGVAASTWSTYQVVIPRKVQAEFLTKKAKS